MFAPYIRDANMAVRAPWYIPERRLLDYLLVFIQEGDCLFEVDDVGYRLRPGDFCLIQPGQKVALHGFTHTVTPYAHFDAFYNPHREESFATRPGQLDLSAYKHLMQPRLELLGGASLPTQFPAPSGEIAEIWLQIARNWRSGDALARMEAEQSLGVVLMRMLRVQTMTGEMAQTHALSWMPSYLSTHLAEPITVVDMASWAGLSPSRFQVVFREAFGESPAKYLLTLRVRHAGELLRDTDWTLAHIAELCGFADVHHFAKTFKRVTGRTPGEHRKG